MLSGNSTAQGPSLLESSSPGWVYEALTRLFGTSIANEVTHIFLGSMSSAVTVNLLLFVLPSIATICWFHIRRLSEYVCTSIVRKKDMKSRERSNSTSTDGGLNRQNAVQSPKSGTECSHIHTVNLNGNLNNINNMARNVPSPGGASVISAITTGTVHDTEQQWQRRSNFLKFLERFSSFGIQLELKKNGKYFRRCLKLDKYKETMYWEVDPTFFRFFGRKNREWPVLFIEEVSDFRYLYLSTMTTIYNLGCMSEILSSSIASCTM